MPNNYYAPGVYVEEISKFPPSVAQVETAIPAFIGYTEKATKLNQDDLLYQPTLIKSLLEFENLFGGAPELDDVLIVLDGQNELVNIDTSNSNKYYLYDSLQLFFANGGGKCYIISVGDYNTTVDLGSATTNGILRGLDALKKKDEPTIIVCPDATLLAGSTDLYLYQQQALTQAGRLKDRVVLCDLKNTGDLAADVQDFRDNVGMNYLSYAAAYTPWVTSRFTRKIPFHSLEFQRTWGTGIQLESLTTDTNIQALIANLRTAIKSTDDIQADIIDANVNTPIDNLKDEFNTKVDQYMTTVGSSNAIGTIRTALRILYDYIAALIVDLDTFTSSLPNTYTLKNDVTAILAGYNTTDALQTLLHHSKGFDTTAIYTNTFYTSISGTSIFTGLTHTNDAIIDGVYAGLSSNNAKGLEALNAVKLFFAILETAISDIFTSAKNYERNFDTSLVEAYPFYKNILQTIQNTIFDLPPSGLIAGVYARVDNDRGVWKAPANVSLNGVLGLTQDIDEVDQSALNVDVNAGKSVNALRTFVGKGVMVWGARTLAGNDNEWRYISVRRYFNTAEESIKKASAQFVFEPNDANTWVKVRAMIENYLTIQWRAGALVGAKPEQAFYVRIGLGETMTADDVNNGIMAVEIGMAVVRPAEFIILRFSHKMQES